MTQIMTASMTEGQIENAVNKLRDAMRKHRCEITLDVAQQVLGVENLGMMMFTPFRERAEAVSKMITRRVSVNRTRTSRQAIDATGRKQYINSDVVAAMPKGTGDEVEVIFFQPRPEAFKNGVISDDGLAKEFDFFGLVPADPYSLAAVNEADPSFADEHPNGTHWQDADGKWCYAAFRRWSDERAVSVRRRGFAWRGDWWFAGLRK